MRCLDLHSTDLVVSCCIVAAAVRGAKQRRYSYAGFTIDFVLSTLGFIGLSWVGLGWVLVYYSLLFYFSIYVHKSGTLAECSNA